MLKPIFSPLLQEAGVKHAFFTREGGISQGIYHGLNGGLGSQDDPNHIAHNRKLMTEFAGFDEAKLLSLYQIHSSLALEVDAPWSGAERPQADGMVSQKEGLMLGIATADCGPILFADSHSKVIGACHAGWKGAFSGILEASILKMEALGAERSKLMVALGPMLSQKNYEVGAEFIARFLEQDQNNRVFFQEGKTKAHAYFDLQGYIRARLQAFGVKMIDALSLCTYADEKRFFSYRRKTHRQEADYGRQISAIWL